MKNRKRLFELSMILVSVLALVSCATMANTKNASFDSVFLTNNREDEDVILSGETIVFTLTEPLPASLAGGKITWYLNDEEQSATGNTLEVKTEKGLNLRYTAKVVIEKDKFKVESNKSSAIAIVDKRYTDVALEVYKLLDETIDMYKIDKLPGYSVALYGKDGAIDFEVYEGYTSLNTLEKNTKDSKHAFGSISKSFIAASLIKLSQEKGSTLSFDMTIGDFLSEDDFDPDYKDRILKKISLDVPIYALMNHTSGIDEFVGLDLGLNLLKHDWNSPIINFAGRILTGHKLEYPYKDDWRPERSLAYIFSKYDPDRGYVYSTPNYIILGMIMDKYLAKTHPGVTISQYVNENFILPFSDQPVILPPGDIDSYDFFNTVADPHIYDTEFDNFIEEYSNVSPKVVKLFGFNKDKKPVYDFRDVFDGITEGFCLASWTAGGFVGNAHQIARTGYNLLSTSTKNPLNKEVRAVITEGMGTDSWEEYKYSFYECEYSDENDENTVCFYGHNGKNIGASNYMVYHPATDTTYVLIMDVNANEPQIHTFLQKLSVAVTRSQL